jgi:putative transcription factor
MPTCEVCGREVPSVQEVTLEGAKLLTCSRCAKLGQPAHKSQPAQAPPRPAPPSYMNPERIRTLPLHREPIKPRRAEREIVPVENFAALVRKAREQRGLSHKEVARQLNERESVIAKLETGKMTPTTNLARKMERLFKLTLLEEAESLDTYPGKSSSPTTFGDVVEVRKKKPTS